MHRLTRWLTLGLTGKGCLEAKSEKFLQLFPKDARLELMAQGFEFTEGPVWFAEEQFLLFSDIPANRIMKLKRDGGVEVFREPSGNSNGLTRDQQGRLIACEHGNRRVTRTEDDGTITVLADQFEGKRLNSPNDVVVKSDGAIYFTDPPYGIERDQQEQPVQGVYRLSADGSRLALVADDFVCPNGLAFSPDEKQLYIDDSSDRCHIRVFDVNPDGTLSNGRVSKDLKSKRLGWPDGMKLDEAGNLFCTGPGGVWVIDSRGNHLGMILIPEIPSNCAWGDEDRRTLYITARTSVYRIRVNASGIKSP